MPNPSLTRCTWQLPHGKGQCPFAGAYFTGTVHLCGTHYRLWQKQGRPVAPPPTPPKESSR